MKSRSYQEDVWTRIAVFLSRRADSTVRGYMSALNDLLAWLGAEVGTDAGAAALVGLTDVNAEEYARELTKRTGQVSRSTGRSRVAEATVKHRLGRLRTIYRELIRARLLTQNPFDLVASEFRGEVGTKRPTEAVQPEDVQKMLGLPDRSRWKGRRDLCLLAVLFGGGLRLEEATRLRICDVSPSTLGPGTGPSLRLVKAKGTAVPSLVALPAWTAEPVLGWRAERLRHGASELDALLGHGSGRNSRSVSVKTGYRCFKKYAMILGLETKSPHSARASFATYLDSLNVPLADISAAMRHKYRNTTETYIKRAHATGQSASIQATYQVDKKKKSKRK